MKRKVDVSEVIYFKSFGHTNTMIANLLNVDEATIRRAVKKYEKDGGVPIALLSAQFNTELETPIEFWIPEDGKIAVIGDTHVPITDYDYFNKFVKDCKRSGVPNLVIAGDFWNADALSSYFPKQLDAGLEREKAEGFMLMDFLTEQFDRIIFTRGNHDYRYVKKRDYDVDFKTVMKELFEPLGKNKLDKIEFSNLDHCRILSPNGVYYVCHPKAYNRSPLTTARILSAKYNTHVITAHSHHCAIGYAIDGKHVVCEVGGFFDASRTQYLQDSTTYPEWTRGYVILDEQGKLRLESPGWSV